MDKVKLIVAALLLGAGIGAFYYFGDHSTLVRVLVLLVLAGASLAVVYQTTVGRTTWGFVTDAQTEVKKVVWPTRKEALQTTGVVMVMVLVMAILLWALDSTLMWLVGMLTGQRG
jgi:preprotein translocase subunit SecE